MTEKRIIQVVVAKIEGSAPPVTNPTPAQAYAHTAFADLDELECQGGENHSLGTLRIYCAACIAASLVKAFESGVAYFWQGAK